MPRRAHGLTPNQSCRHPASAAGGSGTGVKILSRNLVERRFVLGASVAETAEAIGVSVGTFLKMVDERRMPRPRMINSRRVWDTEEVRAAFKALPHDKQSDDGETDTWADSRGLTIKLRYVHQFVDRHDKPLCSGSKNVLLLPADVLDELKLGFPGRILADSIRVRGLKHALSPFPPDQRKLITQALTASETLLPDTNQLWIGWKGALAKSGLGKELGLIKPTTHPYGPILPPNRSGLQLH